MFTLSETRPAASTIAVDERLITIRATKGSGEKPRYLTVQKHTDNWISLLNPEIVRELFESAEEKYIVETIKAGKYFGAREQERENFEAWFLASQVSSRMSKEAIEVWFNADMAAPLVSALQVKGVAADKIGQVLTAYRTKFMELAGRNVSMTDAIKEQLEKCLALLPEGYENILVEKLIDKLNSVSEAANMIDAL